MNNSGNIQTSQNADLITFTVLVEGNALSGVHHVHNVIVSKEINRIPTATIIISDGDAPSQDFALSNEDLLIPGKKIEIKAGYHSDEETIFKGIVIKHSIKIRSSVSYLILECKDEAVKMTVGRKSKFFYKSKDSDIFDEIVGSYSLEKDIEATKHEHPELVQYNASDWDFVLSRAQASGKLCIADDGKLSIKKPDLGQSEVETVAYGSTIMDFDAEIDARDQVKDITSYSWNFVDQELAEVKAKDPSVSLNGNLSTSDLSKVIGLDNVELRHGGNLHENELKDWADATALYQQLARVRGRVKFQGIPAVKPNTILKLEGVGDRFNGKVYVTGVQHNLSDGDWTVDAQFGLDPTWFSETYDIHTPAASGLLPAIKGLHIGVVSKYEDDPDGEARVLVKIPIVDPKKEGIWCRISTLDAGKERGSFFFPEEEDEVIVGFINEDPNDAVILGMLHSGTKTPPYTVDQDNAEKGFVTREELKFVFDDVKKSITLSTPNGKVITMDEDADNIIIEDDHSNVLTMDSSGIKMESAGDIEIKASGDVKIEGMNVNIAANAEFKAEGSAGAEVSTSAIAVLKGSLVQIN